MKRISSQLAVLGLVAVLGLATAGSVEAENVALARNGAVAVASSTGFGDTDVASVDKIIDDVRSGIDAYWTDDTVDDFPDVVQINFFGTKTIDRVVVFSVQEELRNFGGIDPTDTDNCLVYVLVDFTVEGWNGSNWVTLGTVTDNDLCKRTVTFAPFRTDQIRIDITAVGGFSLSRIAEVEAWEAE
ncbi:MAG TPA: hypothetical protein VFJ48_03660 [Casimicrobiaceae bacterium]|nr:hypothetical protein [Casimicrobiaceae bacterium]